MRPLLIGPDERAEIKRVVDFADKNRMSTRDLFAVLQGKVPPPGDARDRMCLVPVGFRCAFTIEQHVEGLFRHLSVSVDMSGRMPNTVAVDLLAKEFGFKHKLADKQWQMWIEETLPAINILEKIE